jgi:hypothetical protein
VKPLKIKSAELQGFLILQEKGLQTFYLEDVDFYVISRFDGEIYRLGFIDLRTRIGLRANCETVEDEVSTAVELRDVPWNGMRLKAVFSLYPLRCVEDRVEGALALKLNFEPHWAMYDWAKIAQIVMRRYVEGYVKWLMERFGPVDAVRIV